MSLCVGLAADWRPVWGPCEPELNQLILFLLLLNILEMDAGDDINVDPFIKPYKKLNLCRGGAKSAAGVAPHPSHVPHSALVH